MCNGCHDVLQTGIHTVADARVPTPTHPRTHSHTRARTHTHTVTHTRTQPRTPYQHCIILLAHVRLQVVCVDDADGRECFRDCLVGALWRAVVSWLVERVRLVG